MSKTEKLPKIGSSAGRFHKGQTEKKSTSFIEKGIVLGDEVEEDSSEAEIEQIDEAEFRKPKTSSVSKISSSAGRDIANQAEQNKSTRIEEKRTRKSSFGTLKRKNVDREWEDTNSIANRTRSKMTNVKKFSEFCKISLDSSDESTSSSSDSDLDQFDDEDFQVEEDDAQNESANEDLRTEKISAEKQALKGRRFSDEDREEEIPNPPRCEFPLKKRQRLTSDSSDKRNGVPQQNDMTYTNIEVVHNGNTEDGLKEGGDGKLETENSLKNSKDLSAQKDREGAEGVNALDFFEESEEDVERRKTISPSRSENVDCGHHDDGFPTLNNCDDKTSSHSHGPNDQNEKPTLSDEIETVSRTINKQLLEENEELEPAPEPQSQNTLPLNNRFEDKAMELSDKTESQKEAEGLFDELNGLGSVNCPKVGPSNRKEPNKAVSGANSMKRLNGGSNKASFNDSHVGGVSNRDKDKSSSFVEKGYEDEYMESEERKKIEGIDKSEATEKEKHYVPKFGQELNKEDYAAFSGKNVKGKLLALGLIDVEGFDATFEDDLVSKVHTEIMTEVESSPVNSKKKLHYDATNPIDLIEDPISVDVDWDQVNKSMPQASEPNPNLISEPAPETVDIVKTFDQGSSSIAKNLNEQIHGQVEALLPVQHEADDFMQDAPEDEEIQPSLYSAMGPPEGRRRAALHDVPNPSQLEINGLAKKLSNVSVPKFQKELADYEPDDLARLLDYSHIYEANLGLEAARHMREQESLLQNNFSLGLAKGRLEGHAALQDARVLIASLEAEVARLNEVHSKFMTDREEMAKHEVYLQEQLLVTKDLYKREKENAILTRKRNNDLNVAYDGLKKELENTLTKWPNLIPTGELVEYPIVAHRT